LHVGVDAFVTTLNDRELEYEVLKLEPKTLEEAANHAMRLDALARLVDARTYVSATRAGGQGQSHPRNIFAVTDDKQEKGENADLLQRIAQLEKQRKQATTGSNKNAQGSSIKANSKKNGGRRSSSRGPAEVGQLRLKATQIALVSKLTRAIVQGTCGQNGPNPKQIATVLISFVSCTMGSPPLPKKSQRF